MVCRRYGYRAMYVFLFIVGIRAKPRNWLVVGMLACNSHVLLADPLP